MDDHPHLAFALVADHLGKAVQLADLVSGIADEGAHLVDDEDQVLHFSAGGLLRVDPGDQFVGDPLRRDLLVAEHVVERLLGLPLIRVLSLGRSCGSIRQAAGERSSGRRGPRRFCHGTPNADAYSTSSDFSSSSRLAQTTLDARHDEVLGEPHAAVELGEEDLADRVGVVQ